MHNPLIAFALCVAAWLVPMAARADTCIVVQAARWSRCCCTWLRRRSSRGRSCNSGAACGRTMPGTTERLTVPTGHALDEIGDLTHSANALLDANQIAMQRERELRAEIEVMEAQYRQIFDFSSAGIFVLDGEGRLINSNPTALRVIGLPREQVR